MRSAPSVVRGARPLSLARTPFRFTPQRLRMPRTQRMQQWQPVPSAQEQTSRELEREESAIEAFKAAVSCLMPFLLQSLSQMLSRGQPLKG